MQEFSSVTASSYDAESLAPMLTEKAQEGWSVVSIVSAGTNVVAYLTRGGDSAAPADTGAVGDASSTADVAPAFTPAADAAPVIAAAAAVDAIDDVDAAAEVDAAAVPADATAISPTLPGEVVEPVVPVAETSLADAEATAAVEASGEPEGWGAAPAAEVTTPTLDTTIEPAAAESDDGPSLGALAGGVGIAAAGGAALAGDAASDVSGGLADTAGGLTDTAGDTLGGLADTATDAGVEAVAADAAAETEAVAEAAAETEAAAEVESEVVAEAAAETEVAAEAEAASGVPAGWYADPSGRFELRYWDGNAWTEHVSRAGQQYTDPPVA
jgi:hypothetical protein